MRPSKPELLLLLSAAALACLLSPGRSTRAGPVTRYSSFRALGVQSETSFRINGLTCGRNGREADEWLQFCVPRILAQPRRSAAELEYFIRNFGAERAYWDSDPERRWTQVLVSNLQAVIVDASSEHPLSEPRLCIGGGMGDRIASTEVGLFLILPRDFSLGGLRDWVTSRGRLGWGDDRISTLLQHSARELAKELRSLSAEGARTPPSEDRRRLEQLSGCSSLRVERPGPARPGRDDASAEPRPTTVRLAPPARRSDLGEFCASEDDALLRLQDVPESVRSDLPRPDDLETCLRRNAYTGRASTLAMNGDRCVLDFSKGELLGEPRCGYSALRSRQTILEGRRIRREIVDEKDQRIWEETSHVDDDDSLTPLERTLFCSDGVTTNERWELDPVSHYLVRVEGPFECPER